MEPKEAAKGVEVTNTYQDQELRNMGVWWKGERTDCSVMQRRYDSYAQTNSYGLDRRPKMIETVEAVFSQVVPESILKGAKILDIACGRGLLLDAAARKGAKELVGMDISEGMLGLAENNLSKYRPGCNIRLLPGNMLALDALFRGEEKSFDIITIANVLVFYKDEEIAIILSQAARLLKDGGYLIILTRTNDKETLFITPDNDNLDEMAESFISKLKTAALLILDFLFLMKK